LLTSFTFNEMRVILQQKATLTAVLGTDILMGFRQRFGKLNATAQSGKF